MLETFSTNYDCPPSVTRTCPFVRVISSKQNLLPDVLITKIKFQENTRKKIKVTNQCIISECNRDNKISIVMIGSSF